MGLTHQYVNTRSVPFSRMSEFFNSPFTLEGENNEAAFPKHFKDRLVHTLQRQPLSQCCPHRTPPADATERVPQAESWKVCNKTLSNLFIGACWYHPPPFPKAVACDEKPHWLDKSLSSYPVHIN